jgi:hypothetical protein
MHRAQQKQQAAEIENQFGHHRRQQRKRHKKQSQEWRVGRVTCKDVTATEFDDALLKSAGKYTDGLKRPPSSNAPP